jgi:ribosome-binding factor A
VATDAELVEQFFSGGSGATEDAGLRRDHDRKLKQLAREVHRVISHALADLSDRRLASIFLVDVQPAPDAGRFRVEVSAGAGATVSEVSAALEAAKGHMRGELALALARKRVQT